MARAHDNPNVVTCCVGDDMLKQLLPYLQDQLEVCQKSLSGWVSIALHHHHHHYRYFNQHKTNGPGTCTFWCLYLMSDRILKMYTVLESIWNIKSKLHVEGQKQKEN